MTDVAKACERTWRRLGVPREARDEMLAEIRADLDDAGADGVSALDYVGGDPVAFARQWAMQRDLVRPRLQLAQTAILAVLGALPSAGLGLFFAYGLSSDTFKEAFGSAHDPGPGFAVTYSLDLPVWLILGLYVLAGLGAAAGAFVAVRSYFAWSADPALDATSRLLALGVLPALGLAVGASMTYAWSRSFDSGARTMAGDALVATVVFALGVAALRVLAVRSVRAGRQWRLLPQR
ncbi:MAG: hypothetical protein WD800_06885 [Dehalococcoidia bacterium]